MVGLENVDLVRHCGLSKDGGPAVALDISMLHRIIAVKLASQGFAVPNNDKDEGDQDVLNLAGDLFKLYTEQSRLLESHLCPIDQRVQNFVDDALSSTGERVELPRRVLTVDRYGLAKELSLPQAGNEFHSEDVSSYRLSNGVLHNPLNDRRTTKGVFHVADYGLPVPGDKIAVPLVTYARLLKAAFEPPKELNTLPYTADWPKPVQTMVSLQLRPLVCPEVPGVIDEKRLEIRFFVPGGCVANLDFVESIFGNAGDPNLPENDAGLDTKHWTGTTGCVVLAPHLRKLKKRDLGLPNERDATDDQKRTGMCWSDSDPDELYNKGSPFKITMRDVRGIMVTILADNYFGYCKKEVKTQIGLSANIFGLAEEEHAGGALAFKSVNLGDRFEPKARYMEVIQPKHEITKRYKFSDALKLLGDSVTVHPEGYATDKRFPNIHVLPEDMSIDVNTQKATWTSEDGQSHSLRVLPGHIYVHPSGFKVQVAKHPKSGTWRLVGTLAEATYCHKPSTVSGGGKSEISKSLNDAVVYGPIYIGDYEKDMEWVDKIVHRDYSGCLLPQYEKLSSDPSRPLLSPGRTLGSVIKLLSPDDIYTDEHNAFLDSIPNHIRAIVFAIKQNYKAEWGDEWRKHFTVDEVNGASGHELKVGSRQIVGSYLRVGFGKEDHCSWRNYKLRQDFVSASKVQMEDDITASVVVPREQIPNLPDEYSLFPCVKIGQNCEWRLFQRPDDAIHPGYDKQTEQDMSDPGLFSSNFKPIGPDEMRDLTETLNMFDLFTEPMQNHMKEAVKQGGFNICSAKPRIWHGQVTKNPRYLQVRPDVAVPRDRYLAELGARLYRGISVEEACLFPVAGVLGGRRNNPPDELNGIKIRPLCVYNPIHYQELPELFMEYITCVTGKSPSTTGAGFEGALSKGPFNAIAATADLNNALVSMILTNYGGFSSAAGWIGPDYRVDHDISLIVPEVWCRMTPKERDPQNLIARGELEQVDDFEHQGRIIPASRLGYRITKRFVHAYLCRIFDNPSGAFPDDMLHPEEQNLDVFADGVENIVQAQQKCAEVYFRDGTIDDACPPLKVLLHMMAHGQYEGKSMKDPDLRAMFTRENLMKSDWYLDRLKQKQQRDVALWKRNVAYLESFVERPGYEGVISRLDIAEKLDNARTHCEYVQSADYLTKLNGTLGADPIHGGYKP